MQSQPWDSLTGSQKFGKIMCWIFCILIALTMIFYWWPRFQAGYSYARSKIQRKSNQQAQIQQEIKQPDIKQPEINTGTEIQGGVTMPEQPK